LKQEPDMTHKTDATLTRRSFIKALAAVSALALLTRHVPLPGDEIIEVDGWILKRSDLV
jgi:hypothetical protein